MDKPESSQEWENSFNELSPPLTVTFRGSDGSIDVLAGDLRYRGSVVECPNSLAVGQRLNLALRADGSTDPGEVDVVGKVLRIIGGIGTMPNTPVHGGLRFSFEVVRMTRSPFSTPSVEIAVGDLPFSAQLTISSDEETDDGVFKVNPVIASLDGVAMTEPEEEPSGERISLEPFKSQELDVTEVEQLNTDQIAQVAEEIGAIDGDHDAGDVNEFNGGLDAPGDEYADTVMVPPPVMSGDDAVFAEVADIQTEPTGEGIPEREPTGVIGTLRMVSLSEVVQGLELGRKTARIEVRPAQDDEHHMPSGRVYVEEGRMVHARLGQGEKLVVGESAFYELAKVESGTYRIRFGRTTQDRSIKRPTGYVILEAMRRIDEEACPAVALPPLPLSSPSQEAASPSQEEPTLASDAPELDARPDPEVSEKPEPTNPDAGRPSEEEAVLHPHHLVSPELHPPHGHPELDEPSETDTAPVQDPATVPVDEDSAPVVLEGVPVFGMPEDDGERLPTGVRKRVAEALELVFEAAGDDDEAVIPVDEDLVIEEAPIESFSPFENFDLEAGYEASEVQLEQGMDVFDAPTKHGSVDVQRLVTVPGGPRPDLLRQSAGNIEDAGHSEEKATANSAPLDDPARTSPEIPSHGPAAPDPITGLSAIDELVGQGEGPTERVPHLRAKVPPTPAPFDDKLGRHLEERMPPAISVPQADEDEAFPAKPPRSMVVAGKKTFFRIRRQRDDEKNGPVNPVFSGFFAEAQSDEGAAAKTAGPSTSTQKRKPTPPPLPKYDDEGPDTGTHDSIPAALAFAAGEETAHTSDESSP